MNREVDNVYILSAPSLEELCGITVTLLSDDNHKENNPLQSSYNRATITCRGLIFLDTEILATPLASSKEAFQVILQQSYYKTGQLIKLLKKLHCQVGKPYRVAVNDFESCLQFSLFTRLSKSWCPLGSNLISSDFLTNCRRRQDAINIRVVAARSQICLTVRAHSVFLPQFQLSDLELSNRALQKFSLRGEIDEEDFNGAIRCIILPSMKKGRLVGITSCLPSNGPFSSHEEICKYWKKMYGYRLPPTEGTGNIPQYAQIFFHPIANRVFTYPLSCVRLSEPSMLRNTQSQTVVSQFLSDILSLCPSLCGSAVSISQPAHTSSTLTPISQIQKELSQCNLISLDKEHSTAASIPTSASFRAASCGRPTAAAVSCGAAAASCHTAAVANCSTASADRCGTAAAGFGTDATASCNTAAASCHAATATSFGKSYTVTAPAVSFSISTISTPAFSHFSKAGPFAPLANNFRSNADQTERIVPVFSSKRRLGSIRSSIVESRVVGRDTDTKSQCSTGQNPGVFHLNTVSMSKGDKDVPVLLSTGRTSSGFVPSFGGQVVRRIDKDPIDSTAPISSATRPAPITPSFARVPTFSSTGKKTSGLPIKPATGSASRKTSLLGKDGVKKISGVKSAPAVPNKCTFGMKEAEKLSMKNNNSCNIVNMPMTACGASRGLKVGSMAVGLTNSQRLGNISPSSVDTERMSVQREPLVTGKQVGNVLWADERSRESADDQQQLGSFQSSHSVQLKLIHQQPQQQRDKQLQLLNQHKMYREQDNMNSQLLQQQQKQIQQQSLQQRQQHGFEPLSEQQGDMNLYARMLVSHTSSKENIGGNVGLMAHQPLRISDEREVWQGGEDASSVTNLSVFKHNKGVTIGALGQKRKWDMESNADSAAAGAPEAKKRSKPKVDEKADVAQLAAAGQLKTVNAVTLIAWLKERGVVCKAKDKKPELEARVTQYLSVHTAES